jgi:hypothetical protein
MSLRARGSHSSTVVSYTDGWKLSRYGIEPALVAGALIGAGWMDGIDLWQCYAAAWTDEPARVFPTAWAGS